MLTSLVRFVLCLRLIPAFVLISLSWPVAAQFTPAFWEVKSKTATVYLLGSMHFGLKSFYPFPEQIERAFERSDVLVVEVDITDISPQEATSALLKSARQPAGQLLSQQISASTYDALKKQAKTSGMPLVPMENFKPWFVALQLVEAEIRKTSYKQQFGVDVYFLKRKQGKAVLELESLEGQLGIFASMPPGLQESFLEQTLQDLSASGDYLDALAGTWSSGNVEQLEALLIEPFRQDPSAKPLYDKLFTERNHRMTEAVVDLLKGERTVFYIVGAAHMLGEDGVVAGLEQAGFKPRRINFDSE